MKTIQSNGGPIMGLNRDHLGSWGGVDRMQFMGADPPCENDYEALGAVLSRARPVSVLRLQGVTANALLLAMPLETAVIAADGNSAYLAQVHYADPKWSFDMITRNDFERAPYNFDKIVDFTTENGEYVFFDAAWPGNEIRNDCLIVPFDAGRYTLMSALCFPDEETHTILYRISRIV